MRSCMHGYIKMLPLAIRTLTFKVNLGAAPLLDKFCVNIFEPIMHAQNFTYYAVRATLLKNFAHYAFNVYASVSMFF